MADRVLELDLRVNLEDLVAARIAPPARAVHTAEYSQLRKYRAGAAYPLEPSQTARARRMVPIMRAYTMQVTVRGVQPLSRASARQYTARSRLSMLIV